MQAITFPARCAVQFGDVPDPVAGPGEVVVSVRASGICHTDYEVLRANYGTGAFPVIPGHEYAGVVAETGAGVTSVCVGDRVVVDPNIECGRCRACRRGWAHLCENLGAHGVTRDGGFAAFSLVRAGALHPIGTLDFGLAALAEPMGCVLNGIGAVGTSGVETALIFGAGPMGMLMALALGIRGVGAVAMVDIDDSRLELAAGFGLQAIAAGSGALASLRRGVDLVVDATGVPAVAGGITDYIANGGKGLFFGVCPAEAHVQIAPFEMFRRQITLAGSHSLNHNIPDALAILAAGGPKIGQIVSHRLPLEEIAQILAAQLPRGSLKVQAVAG